MERERQLEKDALYDQAVDLVLTHRKASISLVQRNLRIGYNRAARLLESMEASGLVSPIQSKGNREILARKGVGQEDLAECPRCGSLDVGSSHELVNCYECGLTIKAPPPLRNAIDIIRGWRIALTEAHDICMSAYRGFHYKQTANEVNRKILKIADRFAELQNNSPKSWVEEQTEADKQLMNILRREFPLFDENGLDSDLHHCEWAIQQDRKRLHNILDRAEASKETN